VSILYYIPVAECDRFFIPFSSNKKTMKLNIKTINSLKELPGVFVERKYK